ncbi:hypothetical protein GCM10009592_17240 [Brachybacterium rhamnosum]
MGVGLPRTLRVLALGTMLGTSVRDPLVTPDGALGSDQLPSDTLCTTCNGAGDSLPRTPKAGVGSSNLPGGTITAVLLLPDGAHRMTPSAARRG